MRKPREDQVIQYIREEEHRLGPLFVLTDGSIEVLCALMSDSSIVYVGLDNEALYEGVMKWLKKNLRCFPTDEDAIQALRS